MTLKSSSGKASAMVLLACGLVALGQDNTGTAAGGVTTGLGQAEAKPHTMRGTVVNSITGQPIYRALVQLGSQSATLTDHEGRFEFDGVTNSYPAFAMKPGFFAENNSFRQYSRFLSGSVDESEGTPVVLKLVPEAVISGTVTGDDGAPIEGLPIQLKTLTITDGLSRWLQRQGTTTNSEGQYRFYELQAGKYAVTSGFHTEGLPDAQSSIAYVPTRFPSAAKATPGTESADSLALAAGDHRQVDLSPPVEKLHAVTGTVSGSGESAVSFRVETAAGEEIAPFARFIAQTGEFRLMLPGGSYMVTATVYQQQRRSGHQLGWLQDRREVVVPQGPVRGLSFVLESAATIPVEVSVEPMTKASQDSGQPDQPPQPNIMLMNTDPAAPMGFLNAQPWSQGGNDTPSGNPGPLAIENVTPGRYVLQAMIGAPWYVAEASCGSVDLMREDLAVGGGAAGCSIRIVLHNDSGSVHVTLRDQPASGQSNLAALQSFIVYLLPLGDLSRQIMPATGPLNGFSMEGVAPGRYLVLAMDHSQELAYRDPEALRRYAALGQEITVTANGKADASVSLVTGEP